MECRVLHVINSLALGGAERLLSDLLPLLQRRGIQNTVLALTQGADAFSASLRASGVEVLFADEGLQREPKIFSPLRIADVARAVKGLRPDIVHAHLAPSFHWCAAASFLCRAPVYITTEHASENHRMSKPLLRGIEKISYSRYRTIICVSDAVVRAMRNWLDLPLEKLPVIPNGIHLETFADRGEPARDVVGVLDGRIGIAMTARFVPAKDHATALRALSKLPERYALVLIGDGPERGAMEGLARELGIESRCLFLGSRTDVPNVLAASSIYLQTSTKEGFGIAALEAMASGLPVVATDVPGLSELVGGAGSLVPPGDAGAAARAILALEAEAAAPRAAAPASDTLRRYSIDRGADAYAALYTSLCGSVEATRAR